MPRHHGVTQWPTNDVLKWKKSKNICDGGRELAGTLGGTYASFRGEPFALADR